MQIGFIFTIVYTVEYKGCSDINQRVKELRKALKMTQVNFSRLISLSSGYLAGIETNKRIVNDRIIKLICFSYKVNEQWLRSGEGEMFAGNDDEQCIKLVSLFRELESKYRHYIIKEINLLLRMQNEEKNNE